MVIEGFLNYLQFERNYSELTLQSYDRDIRSFESFFKNLDTHLSFELIDSDIIRDWMESMMDKGNNAASVNRRLSALRSFYRYAISRNIISSDPSHVVVGPKKEKPLPQFLREKEMDVMLDDVEWNNSYSSTRARTILLTFYETGMRLSELIGLDILSVDFVNSIIKVTGKRNKQRIIPFGNELSNALKIFINIRNECVEAKSDALFLTNKGLRMNGNQVRYEVQKNLGRVCTLKKRTPHVLRHTFATSMLNNEANLESVKKLLGHQSLSTTEIYTHTTFEQLKKIYNQAHPRA